MEIEVKGHSGCTIEIIKENDDLCILKSTDDKKYFSRLVQQANKRKQEYYEKQNANADTSRHNVSADK